MNGPYRGLALVLCLVCLVTLSLAAVAAPKAYWLRVDGLACPFCAYGVEKKLSTIAGVATIGVDIARGTITVIMADGATLDEATARAAVEAAGFGLGGFEAVPVPTHPQPIP